MAPLVRGFGPTRRPAVAAVGPHHPVSLARFALPGLLGADRLARRRCRRRAARPCSGGWPPTPSCRSTAGSPRASASSLAAYAHLVGWPVARAVRRRSSTPSSRSSRHHGGTVECDRASTTCRPAAGGDRPRRRLAASPSCAWPATACRRRPPPLRALPPRAGTFKLDYALSAPVPWRDPAVAGPAPSTSAAPSRRSPRPRRAVARGGHPTGRSCSSPRPTVVRSDPRPRRRHTLWAYCHVPNGSTVDMTAADRGARSSASRPASATSSSPATSRRPRRSRPTTPTASAATSPAASTDWRQIVDPPRRSPAGRGAPRSPASTSARRRPRPAAASTACAAATPPALALADFPD